MYNLIVTASEDACDGTPYDLDRGRVVWEHTDEAIVAKFNDLTPDNLRELQSYPTLFAYENPVRADAGVGFLKRVRSTANLYTRALERRL
jgi:hypothetical protein